MTISDKNASEMFTSLSAMFDGEASAQDIECLLQADSSALSRQLENFHMIQQTLHKDSRVILGLEDSLMLRIRAELDGEDALLEQAEFSVKENLLPFVIPEKTNSSRPTWRVMLSGMAVAASVAFVVILGGNGLLTSDSVKSNLVAEVRTPSTIWW